MTYDNSNWLGLRSQRWLPEAATPEPGEKECPSKRGLDEISQNEDHSVWMENWDKTMRENKPVGTLPSCLCDLCKIFLNFCMISFSRLENRILFSLLRRRSLSLTNHRTPAIQPPVLASRVLSMVLACNSKDTEMMEAEVPPNDHTL